MQETVLKFKEHLRKMDAYNHAFGVLNYDSETAMPQGGSEHLGMTYAVLSEEMYKLTTSPDLKAWVKEILAHPDQVDYVTRREAEELFEDMERTEKIPMEEYVDYQVVQNAASNAWRTAKITDDFSWFAPHLEKLVTYARRFAGYWDPSRPPYDVLLDIYEKGLTMETLDNFFGLLRRELKPLVEAVVKKGPVVDDSFLSRPFSLAKQRKLSDRLMEVLTIDRNHCNIGEVEHPFTTNFSKNDVRITTHYHEKAFASSMYSVIHEGGHALYELHVGDDIQYSPWAPAPACPSTSPRAGFSRTSSAAANPSSPISCPTSRSWGPRRSKASRPTTSIWPSTRPSPPSSARRRTSSPTASTS